MSLWHSLTRQRPNQLVDLLLGAFLLVPVCAGIASFSPVLAFFVFAFFTVMYLIGLATRERARRRRRRRPM